MERGFVKILLDAVPLPCILWKKEKVFLGCNEKTYELFNTKNEKELLNLMPKYQPDGRRSTEAFEDYFQEALSLGQAGFEWMYRLSTREPVPAEVTLKRVYFRGKTFIAEHIRDMRGQRPILTEIKRCESLLQAVNQAAAVLLDIEDENIEKNLYSCMSMMARTVGANRVYIWKNYSNEGELYATQLFEWSEDYNLFSERENISYKDLAGWNEVLSKGYCINGKTRDFSHESKKFLPNVLSVFVAPVFVQEEFWGVVGFDDCHRERVFSENESFFLRTGCLLIGNAFLRNQMTLSLKKAIEEANAASIVKSEFLAHMSHEIRTPMNSIIGFSELAQNTDNPPGTNEYLGKILQNSEWLLQIINDILDVSKIESGKMDIENISFDLQEIFDSCETLVMPKAMEKSLLLHFYIEPSGVKNLFGDPTRLLQILVNLLSNAVKFTNEGTIEMLATIKNIKEKSVTMYFEVKDSGIGISPEHLKIIFEPFTQAESGMTRKFGGTGLGLAITKDLIELMGGVLHVESKQGEGSKFSFELTFGKEEKVAAPAKKVIFNQIEKPAFEGEILICEDNEMNQIVIIEHLKRVGLKTVVAHNGKEGVDLVKARMLNNEKQFDLIFMDIHMPVMDGMEAASEIIALGTNTPIVAMTANVMKEDRAMYMSVGMKECMGKPFTTQELWKCLTKHLNSREIKKDSIEDHELHQKCIDIFVRDNKGIFGKITDAISAQDYTLAHRLAHTLKCNAGQINKKALMRVATEVERNLAAGKNLVTPHQLEALKTELEAVLTELMPLVSEPPKTPVKPLDSAKVKELLSQLKNLLQDNDSECLKLVNELSLIPDSENLIQHIETFDFEAALTELLELY